MRLLPLIGLAGALLLAGCQSEDGRRPGLGSLRLGPTALAETQAWMAEAQPLYLYASADGEHVGTSVCPGWADLCSVGGRDQARAMCEHRAKAPCRLIGVDGRIVRGAPEDVR